MHRALRYVCLPNNQQVYGENVKGSDEQDRRDVSCAVQKRAGACECGEERLRGSAAEPGPKDLISSHSTAAGLPAGVKGFRITF